MLQVIFNKVWYNSLLRRTIGLGVIICEFKSKKLQKKTTISFKLLTILYSGILFITDQSHTYRPRFSWTSFKKWVRINNLITSDDE